MKTVIQSGLVYLLRNGEKARVTKVYAMAVHGYRYDQNNNRHKIVWYLRGDTLTYDMTGKSPFDVVTLLGRW